MNFANLAKRNFPLQYRLPKRKYLYSVACFAEDKMSTLNDGKAETVAQGTCLPARGIGVHLLAGKPED
jgi:hypothetical protein